MGKKPDPQSQSPVEVNIGWADPEKQANCASGLAFLGPKRKEQIPSLFPVGKAAIPIGSFFERVVFLTHISHLPWFFIPIPD